MEQLVTVPYYHECVRNRRVNVLQPPEPSLVVRWRAVKMEFIDKRKPQQE